MSGSAITKSSVILHTIAITATLAIVSGYLPLPFPTADPLRSMLSSSFQIGKF